MTWNLKTAALVTLLAVVAGACAVADEASNQSSELPTVSVICAEETVECDDMVTVGPDAPPITEPGDPGPPPPDASSSGMIAGEGLSVSEALQSDATGPLAVRGFFLDDGSGPRLCEALAESFPPQCGGASVAIDGLTGDDLGPLQSAGNTTWSDQPVIILGDLVDGTLVATPFSI